MYNLAIGSLTDVEKRFASLICFTILSRRHHCCHISWQRANSCHDGVRRRNRIRDSRAQLTRPSGKSFYANPNTIVFVQSCLQKYLSSVFHKSMSLIPRPASFEEGRTRRHDREAGCDGRVSVGDDRRKRVRRRRVVLAPLGWC